MEGIGEERALERMRNKKRERETRNGLVTLWENSCYLKRWWALYHARSSKEYWWEGRREEYTGKWCWIEWWQVDVESLNKRPNSEGLQSCWLKRLRSRRRQIGQWLLPITCNKMSSVKSIRRREDRRSEIEKPLWIFYELQRPCGDIWDIGL